MKDATFAPRVRATMPEMPEPSSMHVELDDSRPDVNRTLLGDAIHSAKRGVTAQTTAQTLATYLEDAVGSAVVQDTPK